MKIYQQHICNTRNNKGCPSGRRKIPVRHVDLQKGIWGTGNGNYVGKYEIFFSFYLNSSKCNQPFKAKTITKYCKVYNICRNKMFANDSVKSRRGETEVYCV